MAAVLPERLSGATTIGCTRRRRRSPPSAGPLALYATGLARLCDLGFTVRESSHSRGVWHQSSAPPQVRVADLYELFADPEVDVVLPSLGGHVGTQMLPGLDFERIAAAGKALVGSATTRASPWSPPRGATIRAIMVTLRSGADVTKRVRSLRRRWRYGRLA